MQASIYKVDHDNVKKFFFFSKFQILIVFSFLFFLLTFRIFFSFSLSIHSCHVSLYFHSTAGYLFVILQLIIQNAEVPYLTNLLYNTQFFICPFAIIYFFIFIKQIYQFFFKKFMTLSDVLNGWILFFR